MGIVDMSIFWGNAAHRSGTPEKTKHKSLNLIPQVVDLSSRENGPNRRQTANPRESTNIHHPSTPISVDTHYRMGPLFDSVQLPYKWLKSMVYDTTIVLYGIHGVYQPTHITGGHHPIHWFSALQIARALVPSAKPAPARVAFAGDKALFGWPVPESSSNHIQHSHEIMTHL